ncbi:cysteine desulfurase [Limibaculum sp. M0105]|uniref:Cysteine desulfurase n=1 Tax=Thermohalobaculum xanthum TaxID=2753746 RepID=A0A8J7M9J0_9RHOB|nr:cysteine desulfurase family protein [Thermohalobaculum xanthum]MBK0400218.1 cysteine desulfurase [Thermohalobaculum xanthum]
MTGLDGRRVYLDWNATAPLRPEARDAMLAAMDEVGNPSSVHAEGRAARAIVEKAREQVAALVGCEPDEVVFTSGATEGAGTVIRGRWSQIVLPSFEHDCVEKAVAAHPSAAIVRIPVANGGYLPADDYLREFLGASLASEALLCIQSANSETGVEQNAFNIVFHGRESGFRTLVDAVQYFGKRTTWNDLESPADFRLISSHKISGPKGAGALIVRSGIQIEPLLAGGGQEKNRRSGTENVIGIAGFGAAAEAAQRDLDAGAWDRVEKLRDRLEERLEAIAPDLIIFGREAPRLPNTSCFAVPGWAGETQVIALDLAGFAVSAGSACSSGKVRKASRVLTAMGFDEVTASSAIRVSMGPTTTEAEVMAFADAWEALCRRRASRAA